MCGLLYLRNPQGIPRNDLIKDVITQVGGRGPHSHGWALINRNNHVRIVHGEGSLKMFPKGEWVTALGHSRLATSGLSAGTVPSPEDGQPIQEGDLIVIHNGTLPQYKHAIQSDTHLAVSGSQNLGDIHKAFEGVHNPPQAVIAFDLFTHFLLTVRAGENGGHPLFHAIVDETDIIASINPFRKGALLPPQTGEIWKPTVKDSEHGPIISGQLLKL